MATNSSIPQNTVTHPVEFILEDGVHYNPEFNEYEIVVNGDTVAWAETQGQAWRSYHELLRVEHEHISRNPANAIPVYTSTGELQTVIEVA